MTEETKKKLLYGGGAVASIVALIMFMKNRQGGAAMPVSRAGISGSGGPSSGTSANNSAALNAAVALAVEQSRQQSALQVAQLQANTALGIAGLQAQTAQQGAAQKTAQAALGPGGAVTAAAPAAAKGLFDTIQELIAKAFGGNTSPNAISSPSALRAEYEGMKLPSWMNPGEAFGLKTSDFTTNFASVGSPEAYGFNEGGYVGAQVYDFNKEPWAEQIAQADFFQGSIGGGDSLYFGDSSFNYDNTSAYAEGGSAPGSEGFYG